MIIYHDHPCVPYVVPRGPLAGTFTYDCRCGRVMIVENCRIDATKVFGKEYLITLPTGERVSPSYIDV